jgi:hypothetical protein
MTPHRSCTFTVICGLAAMFATPHSGAAPPPADERDDGRSAYQLESAVISAGGTTGTTTMYAANGSLGQPTAIGAGTTGSYVHLAGFWYTYVCASILTAAPGVVPFVNRLDQNHPNPFNPRTTISFELATKDRVRLDVFDLRGKWVCTLVNDDLPQGHHDVLWSGLDDRGRSLSSNLYLYRLEIGHFVATRKMLLLK